MKAPLLSNWVCGPVAGWHWGTVATMHRKLHCKMWQVGERSKCSKGQRESSVVAEWAGWSTWFIVLRDATYRHPSAPQQHVCMYGREQLTHESNAVAPDLHLLFLFFFQHSIAPNLRPVVYVIIMFHLSCTRALGNRTSVIGDIQFTVYTTLEQQMDVYACTAVGHAGIALHSLFLSPWGMPRRYQLNGACPSPFENKCS